MEDKCCLCGELLPKAPHGRNNPYPLNDGKGDCCDKCNNILVAPARIKQISKKS